MVILYATLLAVCGTGLVGLHNEARAGIPDHELRYEDSLSPAWKGDWDLARRLYREGRFQEALVRYEILLAQKENLEQARWEYTTLLLDLKRWRIAGRQLEILRAQDPANPQYRLAAAMVYQESGQADQAADLYRQLYEAAPVDPEKTQALANLVRALEGSAQIDELLPLMQRLADRDSDDIALQRKLAALLLEAGRRDEARAVLDRLEQNGQEDPAAADLQARIHASDGDTDGAARYWRKLLARNGDNLEAHRELQAYYAERKDWAGSLRHVEALLRLTPDDPVLLEKAADYSLQLGRNDTALRYYDACLAREPENRALANKKKTAQRILAVDLLPLVENGGGEKLWQDLAQVTADRKGVFTEMADFLRERGRTEELVAVLALLSREDLQEMSCCPPEQGRATN